MFDYLLFVLVLVCVLSVTYLLIMLRKDYKNHFEYLYKKLNRLRKEYNNLSEFSKKKKELCYKIIDVEDKIFSQLSTDEDIFKYFVEFVEFQIPEINVFKNVCSKLGTAEGFQSFYNYCNENQLHNEKTHDLLNHVEKQWEDICSIYYLKIRRSSESNHEIRTKIIEYIRLTPPSSSIENMFFDEIGKLYLKENT